MEKEQLIGQLQNSLAQAHRRVRMTEQKARKMLARYEAANYYESSEAHWAKADHKSPDTANSPQIRRRLRACSRFECCENNPYLNGIIQTIANDFSGTGLRIRITDPRVPKERCEMMERRFDEWSRLVKFRQLLWQMRVAKIVDGESFAVAILRPKLKHPVKLWWKIIEADCVQDPPSEMAKVRGWTSSPDGMKLDEMGFPDKYYIYNYHPGDAFFDVPDIKNPGQWIAEEEVCHWYKPVRPWHRGVPELTPSLPLCAVARRYTFALAKCMELQASLAAVLESDLPAYSNTGAALRDENGNPDGPFFDTMPIEAGMFNILPGGFRVHDLNRVPVGQQYDSFMGAITREICRPLMVPYNMQIGSSKDSNMASGILDAGIYTNAQRSERCHWDEECGRKMVALWYEMGCLTEGYFKRGTVPIYERNLPQFEFQWDSVTIKHTDPTKEMNALKIAKDSFLMSDRDIQELYFNKDVEEFRRDILEDAEFELEVAKIKAETARLLNPAPAPADEQDETADESDMEEGEDDEE